ncbi:MAG: UbiA family prenyltransferase [Myxococcota bacterium]|nr:UbiA family prenyltransferase [Myxococcota bacterium]
MRLRAFLELIRLPAVFTAPADVLMGIGLVGLMNNGIASVAECTLMVVSSLLVYSSGMAVNDLFDIRADTEFRPDRPLPSGRISKGHAWFFVLVCQSLAVAVAASVGQLSAFVVFGTILLTYLYNSPIKQTLFGPILMAGCRFGNFLIGFTLTLTFDNALDTLSVIIVYPCLVFAHVLLLTWIARHESHGPITGIVKVLIGLQCLVGFGPEFAAVNIIQQTPELAWLHLGLLGGLWLAPNLRYLGRQMEARDVRDCVMRGIMGIAVLNAAVLFTVGSPLLGLLVFCLIFPGKWVGRWFYAT